MSKIFVGPFCFHVCSCSYFFTCSLYAHSSVSSTHYYSSTTPSWFRIFSSFNHKSLFQVPCYACSTHFFFASIFGHFYFNLVVPFEVLIQKLVFMFTCAIFEINEKKWVCLAHEMLHYILEWVCFVEWKRLKNK